MGTQAAGAILDPVFQIGKVAAALVCQSVQWAVAKQAVEVFGVVGFVTGKVFAFPILKKGITCVFCMQRHARMLS